MHTVEMLGHGLDAISRLGYQIRQEYLGGNGGGGCELKGNKIFFLDLALDPAEQLDQVVDTLRHDTGAQNLPMPRQLRDLLRCGKARNLRLAWCCGKYNANYCFQAIRRLRRISNIPAMPASARHTLGSGTYIIAAM